MASELAAGQVDTSETEPKAADTAHLARRRSRLAIGALLLLLLLVAATAVFAIVRLYRTADDRYIKEAFPLRDAARDAVLQMVNQETAVRGYLITATPPSLKPYNEAADKLASDLATLDRLSERRPELRADVADVRRRIAALQGYYRRQIQLVTRGGRSGQLLAQANIDSGRTLFNQFRTTAGTLQNRADEIVAQAQVSERHTYERTLAFVLALAAAAALIGSILLVTLPERLHRLYRGEQEARRAAERGARATISLEHVADAVILLDEHDTVRQWNAGAAQLLGVEEDDALDRAAHEVIPELTAFDRSLDPDRGAAIVPLAREGEERWLAVSETRFAEGRVLVLRDVTAEQRLEQTRSDFLATASHELRTPLAAVYGAVRTFRREDRPAEPELDERLLTMIEQESERLAEIIDQILVSAKLDRDDLQLSSQTSNVRELCESVLAAAGVRSSSHTLALDSPQTVTIECDPGRLQQILTNLVDNAIKYSPDGGKIDVRVSEGDDTVTIEVSDEGIGISPDAQARIFDKFFRVDPEMARGIGGSGLGLYISKEIVRIMGGSISVSSRREVGSTFTVELPIVAPVRQAEPVADPA